MKKKKEAGEIMNMQEVAALLRISKITAYKLANKGELPAIRVGGSWRFRRQDILTLMK